MGIYYWVCALQVYWNWPITVECAPCAHSTFGFLLAKFNGMALFRRTILSLCTRRSHGSSHWHVRVFFFFWRLFFFKCCVLVSLILSEWIGRPKFVHRRQIFTIPVYDGQRKKICSETSTAAHTLCFVHTERMKKKISWREREKERERERWREWRNCVDLSNSRHTRKTQTESVCVAYPFECPVASEKRDQNRIVSFKDKVFLFFRW